MNALPNDVVLRPRFQLQLKKPKENILQVFENNDESFFLVKRIDDHVFIKFNPELLHFWSPQLHLEINEVDESNCTVYGLFGPNPTLWTFFMFLHFGVATLFIILSIWAYSSATLNRPYNLQIGLMAAMVLIWFALYAFGRAGKRKGKPQMHQLYQFMQDSLN